MEKKLLVGGGALTLIAIIIGIFMFSTPQGSARLDEFATCLKDKGAVFYGAFWCPHCQNQKKMFGSSEKNLAYVECSTPDGQAQLQICQDKHIESYPTWEFPDGSRETGEVALEKLSEKTGCQLPQ